jgi:hypothetical protein
MSAAQGKIKTSLSYERGKEPEQLGLLRHNPYFWIFFDVLDNTIRDFNLSAILILIDAQQIIIHIAVSATECPNSIVVFILHKFTLRTKHVMTCPRPT